jgi:hypothetical protein
MGRVSGLPPTSGVRAAPPSCLPSHSLRDPLLSTFFHYWHTLHDGCFFIGTPSCFTGLFPSFNSTFLNLEHQGNFHKKKCLFIKSYLYFFLKVNISVFMASCFGADTNSAKTCSWYSTNHNHKRLTENFASDWYSEFAYWRNRVKTYILVIRYSSSYRVGKVSVIPQKKECILIPKLWIESDGITQKIVLQSSQNNLT